LVPGATLARIPILGQQPRALAVGPNGSGGTNVYVGIFESGNGTTAMTGGKDDLPYEVDLARSPSGPYGGISPFPDNVNAVLNKYTSLYAPVTTVTPNVLDSYYTPTPPPVSVIVRRQAPASSAALPTWLDENGKDWSIFINGSLARQGTNADRVADWDLIDRDIAVVNTATNAVTYQGGVLNMVMALAVNPATNSVTAVGTDATNQIRYQPMLDGTFIQVLMGTYALGGSAGTKADLNPHLLPYSSVTSTYAVSSIPAKCTTGSNLCAANSIGDPRGIAWNAATGKGYVTSMGTNSVIVINSAGGRDSVLSTPIPVGQGPTGIVLNAVGANASSPSLAYVFNRFDANISVLNLAATTPGSAEVARVALSYDPTPQDIRNGRPLLYNTQLFSGLGQISCGSCHVDARTDRLAWDLGDPTSQPEVINSQPAAITGSSSGVTLRDMETGGAIVPVASVTEHPMKGPFLTMTLVDRMQSPFLHWRGDRANLAAFSPAFVALQGGAAQPTATQIANMQSFLATLLTPPNPFRTITNQYPAEIAVPGPRNVPYRTGNAGAGAQEFEANCRSCHPGNTNRGYLFVNNAAFGINQLRNPPTWQNFYRRDGLWFSDPTASTAGFGFQPDGTFDSTQNLSRDDNMMAFMYSFNGSYPYTPTGLNATNTAVDSHAAVGRQVTLSGSVTTDPILPQLQALADTNAIDLVASGCVGNETRGYVYVGGGNYADDRGASHSLAAMKAFAQSGSPITFTAQWRRADLEWPVRLQRRRRRLLDAGGRQFHPRHGVADSDHHGRRFPAPDVLVLGAARTWRNIQHLQRGVERQGDRYAGTQWNPAQRPGVAAGDLHRQGHRQGHPVVCAAGRHLAGLGFADRRRLPGRSRPERHELRLADGESLVRQDRECGGDRLWHQRGLGRGRQRRRQLVRRLGQHHRRHQRPGLLGGRSRRRRHHPDREPVQSHGLLRDATQQLLRAGLADLHGRTVACAAAREHRREQAVLRQLRLCLRQFAAGIHGGRGRRTGPLREGAAGGHQSAAARRGAGHGLAGRREVAPIRK
jgi:cytochrome c peroxidase